MRKFAIALVATLSLHSISGQTPQKKPAPARQSGQLKLTPAQQAEMKQKMAAAIERAKAEMKTKIQAKLAADQLKQLNETHQRFNAMLQEAKPAAHQAIQAHIGKIQSAIEELNRTKAPIAMEKYFPKAVAAPASARNNRAHDSDPAHRSQRQSQATGPKISKIQVYPAAQGDKVGNGKLPLGQPGDPIHIVGSGFGNTQGQGTVTFLVSNGQSNGQVNNQNANNISTVVAKVLLWSDNEIFTSVPNVTGIGPYPGGGITVTTSGGETVSSNFDFHPLIETQALPITMTNVQWSNPNCSAVSNASQYGEEYCQINTIEVNATQVAPCPIMEVANGNPPATYTDVYFTGYTLKNGWQLDSTILIPLPNSQGTATVQGATINSSSPFFKVQSTSPTQSVVSYAVVAMVHGPAGTHYQ